MRITPINRSGLAAEDAITAAVRCRLGTFRSSPLSHVRLVDLLAAAMTILAERFDPVLFAQVSDAHPRSDSLEEPPRLHREFPLHNHIGRMLTQQPRNLVFVEILMHKRAVQVQRGD